MRKYYNIPETKLLELYLDKKLSTGAIAQIFNCDHVTILNYLKKYSIQRRTRLGNRKSVNITKEVLLNLYIKKKMTQKQIAEKFGHSRYGIQRRMKILGIKSRDYSEAHTKYPKFNFSNDLKEKAYIIGFRLGDLNVQQIHELIRVRCSTTKINQVKLIKTLFGKYGNVHVWKAGRGTYEIVTLLNKSFEFLFPKDDRIEKWILKDSHFFLSFLAGYTDAEGSYFLRKPNPKVGKVEWGIFEIETYDKKILMTIFKKLKSYNIGANYSLSRRAGHVDKRGIKTNKDCWRLTINRKQPLWNFIKLIETHHRHESKIQDLTRVKNNLLSRNNLPYCRPITL